MYTKESELHRTDCGELTCKAHPAGKELRNSSTTTENTPQEPRVLWQSIQFTQEENSKAECLDPNFPCFRAVSLPLGYSLLGGALFAWLWKTLLSKQGYPRIFSNLKKSPSQIRETKLWSSLCWYIWHLLREIFLCWEMGKADMLNAKESACKHLLHKVAINATWWNICDGRDWY